MTICPYCHIEVRCPKCNSKRVSLYFKDTSASGEIIVYCQNTKCLTMGALKFVLNEKDAHKVVRKEDWD